MSATPSNRNILILGCGELGSQVIYHLIQQNKSHMNIHVLVRKEITDPKIKDKVTPIYTDLANSTLEVLAQVFQPFDIVVGCTGFVGGSGTQLKITRAVLDAKVKIYIPWQFGVDYDAIGFGSGQDVFDEQLHVRNLLRKQNLTRWIIISTGMFLTFLFEPWFGVIDQDLQNVCALGSPDNKITFTHPVDIGNITANILLSEKLSDHLDSVIYTSGDTISFRNILTTIENHTNKPVKLTELSVDHLKRELKNDPDNGMLKYQLVFAKGVGVAWDKAITFNYQHGISTISIAEYLK